MASSYSDLKVELIGTGDQSGTWGTTTNVNLGTALGEAITGSADVPFSSADVTLTLTNTNTSQSARNLRLNLTGTSGGARNLILGSGCQIEKFYIINNGLADAVTVKNTTGTGITIAAGASGLVFNNGTNVVNPLTYFSGTISSATITGSTINSTAIGGSSASTGAFTTLSATSISGLTTPLSVGQGGTGAATFTSGALLKGNTTGAIQVASAADIVGQINTTAVTNSTNATRITNTGGWNVTPTGTDLIFSYNGTNVGKLDSSGNLTVIGDVTAYGTI